jgi:hypothetical protein
LRSGCKGFQSRFPDPFAEKEKTKSGCEHQRVAVPQLRDLPFFARILSIFWSRLLGFFGVGFSAIATSPGRAQPPAITASCE